MEIKRLLQRALYYLELVNSSPRVQWIVFCFYVWYVIVLQGVNVFWFDEGHEMLIIRESRSLGEFIHAMRYEGTPWLLHGVVYLLSQVTGDVFVSALFVHVLILFSIGLLVCFALNLGSILATIILLSPALLEYILNVRQYPLAVLAMLLFAATYMRNSNSLSSRLCLVVLSQVCVNAFIVSMAFFAWVFVQDIKCKKHLFQDAWLIAGTVLVTILQLIPASDLISGLKGWHIIPHAMFWEAWWGMWSIIWLDHYVSGTLLCVTVFGTIFCLWRWGRLLNLCASLFSFCIAGAGVTMLLIYKYRQCERHLYLLSWMLLVLMVVVLYDKNKSWPFGKKCLLVLSLILLPSVLFSAEAVFLDRILLPKTSAENAAQYILANRRSDVLLVYPEMNSEAPLYYLNDEMKLFSVARGAFIRRLEWNDVSVDYVQYRGIKECVDIAKLMNRVDQLPRGLLAQGALLLVAGGNVINTNLKNPFEFEGRNCRVSLLRSFRWSMNEWHMVYRVDPK